MPFIENEQLEKTVFDWMMRLQKAGSVNFYKHTGRKTVISEAEL